jgi:hypothetical protein
MAYRTSFSLISFGAASSGAGVGARYLFPGGASSGAADTVIRQFRCPVEGRIVRLTIQVDGPSAAGPTVNYRIFKNGVGIGPLLSFGAATPGGTLDLNIPVTFNDLIAIEQTKSAAITPALDGIHALIALQEG